MSHNTYKDQLICYLRQFLTHVVLPAVLGRHFWDKYPVCTARQGTDQGQVSVHTHTNTHTHAHFNDHLESLLLSNRYFTHASLINIYQAVTGLVIDTESAAAYLTSVRTQTLLCVCVVFKPLPQRGEPTRSVGP